MRVIRKFGFFSLLIVATLLVQNASATILPISSYADGHWQGSRFYNIEVVSGSFLRGRIDFAVYDTLGGNEFVEAGFTAPGDGQYIYAYQIFNDYPASDEAVAHFAVFEVDKNPMDVYEDSIGSQQDDPDSGIEPTSAYFTESNLEAVWLFADQILMRDEHSWLLVFSSDSAPVPGNYEISAESGEFPAVPEPVTLTLLGFGGALAFIRRRKSVR
jgi:hypothetical protein